MSKPRLVKIRDLKPGDMVDLAGDEFADAYHENMVLEYQFAVVDEVEEETPTCFVLHSEASTCGFPPDHVVAVGGHDKDYDEMETV